MLDSAGGHVNDKWQLRGDAHTVWSSPLSIWSAAAWILWHKKCHLAIYERNAGRLYTHTYTHMCGLTAHVVQLREFGSIFSRQKQHAHRKKKRKEKRSLPIKQFHWGVSSVLSGGAAKSWKKIQSGRRLAQFFGQRGNSVISCTHRLPLFLLSSEPQIISPRPAERERERQAAGTVSVELETERRNIQRTPPGQL